MPATRKRGPGRPPLGEAALSETVRVRMTPDLRRAVRAAAKRMGLPEPDWAREAFELAIARGSTR